MNSVPKNDTVNANILSTYLVGQHAEFWTMNRPVRWTLNNIGLYAEHWTISACTLNTDIKSAWTLNTEQYRPVR